MGLYDNIILPEDFELPDFQNNPRYNLDGNDRLWQTKDLMCGQDRYRLRKLESNSNGMYQLERRVPPVQKMTKEGNEIILNNKESNLLWWNIVRPSKTVNISNVMHNQIYTYELTFTNGILKDVRFVDMIAI